MNAPAVPPVQGDALLARVLEDAAGGGAQASADAAEKVREAMREDMRDQQVVFEVARILREEREELKAEHRELLVALGPTIAISVKEALTGLLQDEKVVQNFFTVGYDVMRKKAESKVGEVVINTSVGVVKSKLVWVLAFLGATYWAMGERAARALAAGAYELFKSTPHH